MKGGVSRSSYRVSGTRSKKECFPRGKFESSKGNGDPEGFSFAAKPDVKTAALE